MVAVFLIGILLLPACAGTAEEPSAKEETAGTGTVEVRATDAPPKGVTHIWVTTDNIQVHKADADESTWVTVVSEEKKFDLIEIAGAEVFLGEAEIEVGHYTQIRLEVTEVLVELADRPGEPIEAKLPSERLKVVRPWSISPDEKTVLTLDFEADKFVVITGQGRVQVKPVIRLSVSQGERPLKTREEAPGLAEGASSLEEVDWVLESYGEPGDLKTVLPDTEITVRFDSTESKVGGSAGCNSYFGGYEADEKEITIDEPIGQTAMACPEPTMEQEQEYLATLANAESYEIEEGRLRIFCGDRVLVFTRK